MSYPKRLGAFRKWSKAMEEGAVMDRPEYPKTRGKRASGTKYRRAKTHPRRMRRKRKDD